MDETRELEEPELTAVDRLVMELLAAPEAARRTRLEDLRSHSGALA